jgi:hypothetical protein
MEMPLILKLALVSVTLSSLLVTVMSLGIIREQIRKTQWYLRRERKKTIEELLEFGDELVSSLEHYTTHRITDSELKSYLSDTVQKYNYREYNDSRLAMSMEKRMWPDKFKNQHYVPYAMADVNLPTLRLALIVLNMDDRDTTWKVEIIKLAEIAAFNGMNKLYAELESL